MCIRDRTQRALKLNLQQVQLLKYQMTIVENELKYLTEVASKTKQITNEFRSEKRRDSDYMVSTRNLLETSSETLYHEEPRKNLKDSLHACRSLGYLCLLYTSRCV